MNVNLTPELEELVRQKVETGLYNNQSEVIREALRLLFEQDRIREAHLVGLRKVLAEGLVQADRGQMRDGRKVISDVRNQLKKERKGGR
ncbi:MAG: type II toxin-antitoxin system ParD family antitoxin [Planctomycetota bacterium]